MNTNHRTARPQIKRLLGRVLNIHGRMHLVVNVDEHSGFATVAFDCKGQKRTLQIPLPEVLWWAIQDTEKVELSTKLT